MLDLLGFACIELLCQGRVGIAVSIKVGLGHFVHTAFLCVSYFDIWGGGCLHLLVCVVISRDSRKYVQCSILSSTVTYQSSCRSFV